MNIEKILISQKDIEEKVKALADKINEKFRNKDPLIIALMDGSFIFCSDLAKNLDFDVEIRFVKASSYGNSTISSGKVVVETNNVEIKGRDIILIDDILDTGNTLYKVEKVLYELGAKSVFLIVLVNKEGRREKDIKADLVGFDIDNHFIVGYGMDYQNKGRNFPYIAIINEKSS